ncbi:MAG: L-seryl-tRNA(Sec) selenium transferase [Chloroflexi bacterium]|nr:L-seryl-tRNA(Sec) selenium transferase [Chloroflexota bacterium]
MRKSSPSTARRDSLRQLPSVDRLLLAPSVQSLKLDLPHHMQVELARDVLKEARAGILKGGVVPSLDELAQSMQGAAGHRFLPSLRPVINATGVILHTNLGRAPLSEYAIQAMLAASAGYSNLEFDLDAGMRGSRYTHLVNALTDLSGAEDALAVNNNAAAIFLVLSTVAAGREVIISRGESVEIGGGFRIPDVLAQSGAHLVEVGTTNRTYVEDYIRAITPATAAILRVHSSNFRVVGFTHEPALDALVAEARQHDIPVIYDLGSGSLLDTATYGLHREPTVQETVAAGCAVVSFSGDKLLGGPQGGLIVGQSPIIGEMKRHPLARALRLDKTTIAGLEATLDHYRKQEASTHIPVWQMISARPNQLRRRARAWQRAASTASGQTLTTTVAVGESAIGGGALPGEMLPTWVLRISSSENSPDWLAKQLRSQTPALVVRIEDDAVVLDPRTVLSKEDQAVRRALATLST